MEKKLWLSRKYLEEMSRKFWSQSYNFLIYNYNASVVAGWTVFSK
jgi:hypothetical protein